MRLGRCTSGVAAVLAIVACGSERAGEHVKAAAQPVIARSPFAKRFGVPAVKQALVKFTPTNVVVADFDGDGIADTVAGSSTTLQIGLWKGKSGGADSLPKIITSTLVGFGCSTAVAGDINGDGLPDLLVGACGAGAGGQVKVYFGSKTDLLVDSNLAFDGGQPNSGYGAVLSAVGDVNKDGVDDFAVGAPLFDDPLTDEGKVFLFLGSKTGISTTPAWSVPGGQANAHFGASIAAAGDTDKDGFADWLVGAPLFDEGEVDEGRISLFLGSATPLSTMAVFTAESNQAGARLGQSVAGIRDIEKDGFVDIAAGAPGFDTPTVIDAGAVFVWKGKAAGFGKPSDVIGGQLRFFGNGGGMGAFLAPAGDIDKDGYEDVLVGFENAQSIRIWGGSCEGLIPIDLVPESEYQHQARPERLQPYTSQNAPGAAAGDVDGDGVIDFTVTYGAGIGINAYWDSDLDGIEDETERLFGLDPLKFDTDGDGCGDGSEVWYNNNAALDPKVHGNCADGDYGSGAAHACSDPKSPIVVQDGPSAGTCVPCGVSLGKSCGGFQGSLASGASSACPNADAPLCATSGSNAGACTATCGEGNPCKDSRNPICEKTSGTCVPCDGDFGSGKPSACLGEDQPLCATSGTASGACTARPQPGEDGGPPASTATAPPDLGGCGACSVTSPRTSSGALLAALGACAVLAIRRRRRR